MADLQENRHGESLFGMCPVLVDRPRSTSLPVPGREVDCTQPQKEVERDRLLLFQGCSRSSVADNSARTAIRLARVPCISRGLATCLRMALRQRAFA